MYNRKNIFQKDVMPKLRNSTLVFLIEESQNEISKICLAMKKRGFGINKWNGVGGKVDEKKETIEEAAKREAFEEIGLSVKNLKKTAELNFYFPHNPDWNQKVHAYFSIVWEGEPKESEEMRPKWFSISEIPFEKMWPDDIFWLPKALEGNFVKGSFTFGENDVIKRKKITTRRLTIS